MVLELSLISDVLSQGSPVGEDVHEQLAQSEHLMKEMSRTWEEKLVETGQYEMWCTNSAYIGNISLHAGQYNRPAGQQSPSCFPILLQHGEQDITFNIHSNVLKACMKQLV